MRSAGNVRFQARLSSALPWTVTVTDAKGATVAPSRGTVADRRLDLELDLGRQRPVRLDDRAGSDVLAATGTLGAKPLPPPCRPPAPPPVVPPPPVTLITGLTVSPGVLTLNADGSGLVTAIDFVLARQAQLNVRVGSLQLLNTTAAAGNDHFEWNLAQLPDGRYKLVVTAKGGGRTSTQSADVVVDRTLSGLTASPAAFSPNADGSADTVSFGFSLSQNVPVQVTVQRSGATVATLFVGQLGPGVQTIGWDGTSAGVRLPDGQYTAAVTATDPLATYRSLVPFVIDTVGPALTP